MADRHASVEADDEQIDFDGDNDIENTLDDEYNDVENTMDDEYNAVENIMDEENNDGKNTINDEDNDIENGMDDEDTTQYDGDRDKEHGPVDDYHMIDEEHEKQEESDVATKVSKQDDEHSFEEFNQDAEAPKSPKHKEERVNESDIKPRLPKHEEERTDDSDNKRRAELLSLPPHGSEVFIGGLPRDATENDLRELCEQFGEIFEVKLVKDKETKESKGFAFITFTTRDAAQMAIEEIHDKAFKGKTLRCSLSQVKYKLFIGNVPKHLTENDFRKILDETSPGVENIECYKDALNPGRNRGFIFVEYYNHECAEYAKEKMSKSSFEIEGLHPGISWADPKNVTDASAASQVKVIYVKNLPDGVTPEKLRTLFECHGEVTKIVLPPSKTGLKKRDFGFIHFAERSSALKAVKVAKYEIDGQAIEVVLAKPQTAKKPYNLNPSLGYPGAYNTGYGVGAPEQPVIYGRGAMPTGMAMVPMVLPDGRIGFVMQQPGAYTPPPQSYHRSEYGGGSSRDGADRYGERNSGRRYYGGGSRANDEMDRGGSRNRGRRYNPY